MLENISSLFRSRFYLYVTLKKLSYLCLMYYAEMRLYLLISIQYNQCCSIILWLTARFLYTSFMHNFSCFKKKEEKIHTGWRSILIILVFSVFFCAVAPNHWYMYNLGLARREIFVLSTDSRHNGDDSGHLFCFSLAPNVMPADTFTHIQNIVYDVFIAALHFWYRIQFWWKRFKRILMYTINMTSLY